MTLRDIAALHLINLSLPRDRGGRLCLPAGAGAVWPGWLAGPVRTRAELLLHAGDHAGLEAGLARAVWRYSDKLGGVAQGAGVDFLLRDLCAELGPKRANQVVQRALGVAADGVLGAETRAVLAGAEIEPAPLLKALEAARRAAGGDPVRARAALRVAQVLSPRRTARPLTAGAA
jgi:hypothetical protein